MRLPASPAFPLRLASALALVLAGSLLVSCSEDGEQAAPGPTPDSAPTATGETPGEAPAPDETTAPGGTAEPAPSRPAVPTRPASDAGNLARQIDAVMPVLRDEATTPRDLRRAGEFHQLAVHALVTGTEQFRRRVLGAVRRPVADQLRGEVRAGVLLRALTSPQERLPDWRIVEPPPPDELRQHYRTAERRLGVPWEHLAAIHLVETRMGRIRGTSSAGAQGPMQFIPSTWEIYGEGGDINDPRDAILAAARLLRANGAPGNMAGALYRYNPHDNYVQAVTEHARVLQRFPRMYESYWHWQVLYRHVDGTQVLPVGYPDEPARPVRR